jgi:hypothetical protein
MIQTQFIFRNDYRFDLKWVEFVIIPFLFEAEDNQLILVLESSSTRKYRSSGRIEQMLVDIPNHPVANPTVTRFGQQFISFAPLGKYRLRFFPNFYLGKTSISIYRVLPTASSE